MFVSVQMTLAPFEFSLTFGILRPLVTIERNFCENVSQMSLNSFRPVSFTETDPYPKLRTHGSEGRDLNWIVRTLGRDYIPVTEMCLFRVNSIVTIVPPVLGLIASTDHGRRP